MLKDWVYSFIRLMASIHDRALLVNDAFEASLSDKDLHFLFFGVVGTAVFLLAWLLFQKMRNHMGVVAWMLAFVVMLMLALAVEVGQAMSGTGCMEIGDITAGMLGFVACSLAVGILFGAVGLLVRCWRRRR